ncbi:MAG: hypothetical protein IJH08_01285, partial [Atopobiaceae bacterium]|nr:hypothetical protein [Atopobiaceae bacterium]
MGNNYSLPAWLPEADLYLFDCGDAQQAYRVFGCHEGGATPEGVPIFRFVVWAPNAKSIHVVGDFNDWDQQANPLTLMHDGIWV